MKLAISKIVLLISLLWVGAAASLVRPSLSQSPDSIRKGEVVDKVVCGNDSAQSYALFLPSSYTPDRSWPILYAFDPAARGTVPVERFKEAAEKYGWIVVGSNNSRNGPFQRTADAWKAMYGDTHERFSVDDHRMYITGFSGGARVALTIAASCRDCIAGVIAGGAGFPARMQPNSSMHFLLFGAVGTDDFNFPEVTGLDESLMQAGITHRIEVFSGTHEWPPSEVTQSAIEWMELWAMKLNTRPQDASLIDRAWLRMLARAQSLEDSKKLSEARDVYSDLSTTFDGLRNVSQFREKVIQLENTREVKSAISEEQLTIKKQRETESTLRSLIAQLRRPPEQQSQDSLGSSPADTFPELRIDNNNELRFKSMISKLRQQSNASEDSGTRRVARRVLGGLQIGLMEDGRNFLENTKNYRDAVFSFRLATEVNPDRFGPFFYLAAAQAMSGNKKQSLDALRTAIDKGLSDAKMISDNKWFDSIRNDPRYAEIIARLSKGH